MRAYLKQAKSNILRVERKINKIQRNMKLSIVMLIIILCYVAADNFFLLTLWQLFFMETVLGDEKRSNNREANSLRDECEHFPGKQDQEIRAIDWRL